MTFLGTLIGKAFTRKSGPARDEGNALDPVAIAEGFGSDEFRSFVYELMAAKARSLAPDEGLRTLFGIDAALYVLEAEIGVAYEGGLHPKHRLTGYHDFFVDRIKAHERVLDVGCGNGALAKDVAERSGASIIGMDIVPEHIEIARREYSHPKVEYHVGDVLTDLPEGKYDVVMMSNVLEHLPDRANFLRRLCDITECQRLLIRVPVFERDWRVPLRKEVGAEWRLDATHETEYTLESFADEMAAAGLCNPHLEVRWGEIWTEAVPHGLSDR